MKRLTKLITFILALSMLFSLTACDQNKPEETQNNDKPKETQGQDKPNETTAPAESVLGLLDPYPETVTLTFSRSLNQVSTYPEGVTNDNNGWIKMAKDVLNIECVTAFEAAKGADYDRLTSLAIASGELPDVLYIYGNGSGSGLALVQELYENDMIIPLDELYETYGTDYMKNNYASYGDSVWNGVVFDGQKYALPYAAGSYSPMFWIRSDWMEKLNITLDEDDDGIITRDELVAVAKAFVDNDMSGTGNTIGIALPDKINTNFSVLTDSFGAFARVYMPKEDGTVYHGSTDPKMKDALAWLADLYAQGILDPQYGTRTSTDISELLTNGQLGILMGGWSFGSGLKSIYEMDPTADFKSYNLDNGSGKVNFPVGQISTDQFLVISKECEHPEAVFKIFAQQRAYLDMSAAEQEAQFPELYAQTSQSMGACARPVWIEIQDAQFAYRNQIEPVLSYLETGTSTLATFDPEHNNYYRAWKTYHEDRTNMKSSDWVLYVSRFGGGASHAYKLNQAGAYEIYNPIYAQVPSMSTIPVDFNGMMLEYYIKIITGELPLDAFDEYVAQRKALGDDKICAELADTLN